MKTRAGVSLRATRPPRSGGVIHARGIEPLLAQAELSEVSSIVQGSIGKNEAGSLADLWLTSSASPTRSNPARNGARSWPTEAIGASLSRWTAGGDVGQAKHSVTRQMMLRLALTEHASASESSDLRGAWGAPTI